MRLFVGIKTGCENHLVSLQNELKKIGKGHFTQKNNLHITLKFLGEVPSFKLKSITEAISEPKDNPFLLECQGVSIFNKNGIISVKVAGELGKLTTLYSTLEIALEKRGFEKEKREFRPHITLARNFRITDGCNVETIPYRCYGFKVEELILFESRRDAGKLVYAPLFIHKLAEQKNK
ncbi:MAG: RNA 2',3'-cyclic phosphodiesterase [Christensenellales bacterium]|jgi:2'-5' RNA ligase